LGKPQAILDNGYVTFVKQDVFDESTNSGQLFLLLSLLLKENEASDQRVGALAEMDQAGDDSKSRYDEFLF
jgi:hypothetical protein